MKRRLLSFLSVAAILLSAVSCDDLMEMIGGLEESDGNTVTSFSVTPSSLSLKAEGGEATIAFTAPAVWSATSSAEWITIDPAAGKSGETVVTVTALANTGAERSAKVTVESSDYRVDVTVKQAGIEEVNPPEPPVGEDKWYVCGDFVEWKAESAIPMVAQGSGIYTLELDLEPKAQFKFIKDMSWEVNLGSSTTDAVVAGETVALESYGYNLVFNPGGHVAVTLDVNNSTALITGGNDPVGPTEPSKWYLVVGANNSLSLDDAVEMRECADGKWSVSLTLPAEAEFKFVKDKSWDINLGAYYYQAGNHSPEVVSGESIALTPNGYNVYYPKGGDVNIYLDVDGKVAYLEAIDNTVEDGNRVVFWENDGSLPEAFWDATYRFALEGTDWNGECAATFPEDIWNRIKNGTFYMLAKAGDYVMMRVTTGWWNIQWLGEGNDICSGDPRIIDNGDGTFIVKICFDDDPIVAELDEKHLLFTGMGYTLLSLFYIDDSTVTPPDPPAQEDLEWSVIGHFQEHNWDYDLPMYTCYRSGGKYAIIYYKEGDEFKLRYQGSWAVNRGIDGHNGLGGHTAVQDGPNITLPAGDVTGLYEIFYYPDDEYIYIQEDTYDMSLISWGITGNVMGMNWDSDVPVDGWNWNSDFNVVLHFSINYKAGEEFKIRFQGDWFFNFGLEKAEAMQEGGWYPIVQDGANMQIAERESGKYNVAFDLYSKLVRVDRMGDIEE